ncbi:hypothetical protein [uncultured Polaribacter sp.]|uniref:hypothetical protein n=1 Tax=uncultured Polaribacter sp. TaxID=174711 RepID=UPI0030D974DC|tara:strand:+ start:647 stop:1066 length:420 start_codon:yes stop_codon:yes gene_type:complete
MKNLSKQFIYAITLFLAVGFSSCEDEKEVISAELTIEQKVALLESSEWLLEGFEDRVLYTFKDGKQFTYYGVDSVFDAEPIPGTFDYTITGNLFTVDQHFGNVFIYELSFTCNSTIAILTRDGSTGRLFKRGSNYQECL